MFPLAEVIGGIQAIGAIVTGAKQAIEKIQGGWGAKKKQTEDAKKELQEKLAMLEAKLGNIGQIARAAEAYLRAHENLLALGAVCHQVEEFINTHGGSLGNVTSGRFKHDWQLLDQLYNEVEKNQQTARRVVMDREEWYDEQDKAQINGNLMESTMALERVSKDIRNRSADSLAMEVETMQRHIVNADTALQDTLYRKILDTLQRLATAGAPLP
jgi:hypothetical protein